MPCQFVETYPATVSELVADALIPAQVAVEGYVKGLTKEIWEGGKYFLSSFIPNPGRAREERRIRDEKRVEDVRTRELIAKGYLRKDFPLHYPNYHG